MTVAEKRVRVAFLFASAPDFPDREKTNAVCWNLRLGDACCCNKLLFALVDRSSVHDKHGELGDGTNSGEKLEFNYYIQ